MNGAPRYGWVGFIYGPPASNGLRISVVLRLFDKHSLSKLPEKIFKIGGDCQTISFDILQRRAVLNYIVRKESDWIVTRGADVDRVDTVSVSKPITCKDYVP
jgi:hypothetical protein